MYNFLKLVNVSEDFMFSGKVFHIITSVYDKDVWCVAFICIPLNHQLIYNHYSFERRYLNLTEMHCYVCGADEWFNDLFITAYGGRR